ncbi:MAG: SCP2 sterol-binding domain-containing protein [Actinomycetota bacterium]|nr:SCP2 sterol-binding domain-containing protein [Actinomycetota bacterium]
MSELSAMLSTMSGKDIAQFFATGNAEDIARLVSTAADSELRKLIEDDELREAAVDAGLNRFQEFAVPERLAEVKGRVRFVVTRPRGADDRYDAEFGGGEVDVSPAGSGKPDVTISTGALDFVRLVSGTASAALLLLSGRLRVEGDDALALQIGGVFRVPGSDDIAVNPAALDAVEVAAVVSESKDSYLRDVMKGGFRGVILEEIFRRFPEYIDANRAKNMTLGVGFKIGGGPDDADRYLVSIDKGNCTVTKDGEGERKATIALGGAEFLKLATGNLNPTMAFIRGALKVRGDISSALSLSAVMQIPSPKTQVGPKT